jgi:hypothetical protein
METSTSTSGKHGGIALTPRLGSLREQFIDFCRKIEREFSRGESAERAEVLVQLRDELARDAPVNGEDLELLFVCSVTLDLVGQGWELSVDGKEVTVSPP